MTLDCDLARPEPGKPTLLVLHGLGDSKFGWQGVAPMLDLPGWGWCFANAPIPYGDGFSWFDLSESLDVDADDVRSSHRLLIELIDRLETIHRIPCERLAVMGFSQGCLMTLELTLRHPRPFLAAVGISGWLHDPEAYPQAFSPALARQRILITHGSYDPLIPCALAHERITHLQVLGAPVTWKTYAKAHHLDDGDELAAIRRHLLDAEAAAAHRPAPGEPA
jgi:phospholipase/carboxylesterase